MADTFLADMAIADDAIFDALGETVTINGSGSLVGTFENETAYDLEIQGTRPVFYYQESDMEVVVGNTLTYKTIVYTVKQVESDGVGMGKLILSKV